MAISYKKFMEPAYGPRDERFPIPEVLPVDPADWEGSRKRHNEDSVRKSLALLRASGRYDEVMAVPMEEITLCGGTLPARMYKAGPAGGACLVYIHGGSFVMNDPSVYDTACRMLAGAAKCTVLSLDYGLAPQHKFPQGLEQCYEALGWIQANAQSLGVDGTRLFLAGDSSGGNMAAALTLMLRDRKGLVLRGQILIYPATVLQPEERTRSELMYGTGHLLDYDSRVDMFSDYLPEGADKRDPYASPLYAPSLADLPPALVLLAGCDPLMDQGLQYAQALHEGGTEVTCRVYEGMLHGFITRSYPASFALAEETAAFIRSHC